MHKNQKIICMYLHTRACMCIIDILKCIFFVPLVLPSSVPVGCTLLGGLFLYDIFWVKIMLKWWLYSLNFLQVFGTDVMVTVAKSFDAPIKCKLGIHVIVT